MIRGNQGLTKTYNRFHDPNENSQISGDSGSSMTQWIALFSTPMDGRTSGLFVEFFPSLMTRKRRTRADDHERESTDTAGPTTSTMKCSRRLLDLNRQRALEEGQSADG